MALRSLLGPFVVASLGLAASLSPVLAQTPPAGTPPPASASAAPPGPPPSGQAEANAIGNALIVWMKAFNGGDADTVCAVFALDLRFDFGPFIDGTHDQLCDRLHRMLQNRQVTFQYALDIKEILISGDLAVVRLVWTLSVTHRGREKPVVTTEPGIDVMRHDQDGAWRVFRFIAYTAPRQPPGP